MCFTDALHAACEEQPSLLAAVGLAQGGEPAQLSAEEAAALSSMVATGLEKKNAPPESAGAQA